MPASGNTVRAADRAAVYLDYAATAPMPPAVLAAYTTALALVGNPASIHSQGQNSKRMLEEAREQVAASLGADPVEVTFTGGGTEAVNLAIKGLFLTSTKKRILVTRAEHHATIESVEWLAAHEGAIIDWVPVDSAGRIDVDYVRRALDEPNSDVALVTLLLANNEVGTLQPVAEVAAIAAAVGVPVHVDAIAAYGYVPIDFHALGVAALSVSAHKIGGPVGIGALVIARSARVEPQLHGGSQQRARSGTQDAAGAVAFGAAATLASAAIAANAERLVTLRDRLIAGIRSAVPGAVLRGDPAQRLPGNVHCTFQGCEGDSLLFLLDSAGFSVSTGSACRAGVPEASHVLLAMGVPENEARGALRMTLGAETTEAQIDALLSALPDAIVRASRAGLASKVVNHAP
jgi:cysteine desulfurase